MANGTIAFDTLQTSDSVNTNTTKSIDTSYIFNGVPKAWINFDGGASSNYTRDGFNMNDITDNGDGDYNVNYTNNFSNDDYWGGGSSSLADGSDDANSGIVAPARTAHNVAFTTSSTRIRTVLQTSTASQPFNNGVVCWSALGDLA